VSCLQLGLSAVVVAIVVEATQTELVSTSNYPPFHHSSCIAFDGFTAIAITAAIAGIELLSLRPIQKM